MYQDLFNISTDLYLFSSSSRCIVTSLVIMNNTVAHAVVNTLELRFTYLICWPSLSRISAVLWSESLSHLECKHPVHHASGGRGVSNNVHFKASSDQIQSGLLNAHVRLQETSVTQSEELHCAKESINQGSCSLLNKIFMNFQVLSIFYQAPIETMFQYKWCSWRRQ